MDQGGTFTDVVSLRDGTLTVRKVLSDQADLLALGEGSATRRGTTVATNALLERQGAPTLLLTNRGLTDLSVIGDQTRPDLFDLNITRPPPLERAVVAVEGRIAADGTVLEPARVDATVLARWRADGVIAVAVVLLHGPLAPEEEKRIGAQCAAAGFETVVLGHEVAPSRGFLPRLRTALADAALSPLLPRAPGHYMRSDGGLAREDGAGGGTWRGRDAVLSGPAGGVIATAALCRQAEIPAAFGLDMGGTSADVCRVAGAPERVAAVTVGDWTLRTPAVRLDTVAAGGGSLLSMQGGVFAVGPRSAGSDPGPAAYGRGGPATVTDCEAVLGRLPDFPPVCGPARDAPLDLDAARQALAALSPDTPVEELAAGFQAIAAEHMAQAIHRLAAAMGVDPSGHALVAFGGAGPGHACAVAERLGVETILVPTLAGVFSAVGVGLACSRDESIAPVHGGDIDGAAAAAIAHLPLSGEISARLALRHVGTSELIEVPLPCTDPVSAFMVAHQARFGFQRPDVAVEAVEVRVSVEGDDGGRLSDLPAPADTRAPQRVRAWFDGWRVVPLCPAAAVTTLDGPALIQGAGTTIVLGADWRAVGEPGFLRLTRTRRPHRPAPLDFHPVHTAVFGARIQAIAERMGERLARLARSVSIRQRHDFSCAVFDADGQLVANAPHVPVHLGAMGVTVRDLIARRGDQLAAGQAWASNDPYAGGSHLPDITVIRPVLIDGTRLGFVAARGHHVDVGGIQPGSMPPHATHIDEEGLVLSQILISDGDRFLPPPLPGCRQPDAVCADLVAQIAACEAGASLLSDLAAEQSAPVVTAQLAHLLTQAGAVVAAHLPRLTGTHTATERLDDGTPLTVTLTVSGRHGHLTIDAPPHPGNLNAPRAVAVAALLYVFRCLVDTELPLSEGALRPLSLSVTPGGLLDPVHPAAVAGGNVETSQRLVDALLHALGAQAGSQGTMNNLTVGTPSGAFYETIGGGSGAGPGFEGAHAVQVHMTNTAATDVEELEAAFPVRLERWERRTGSGGAGQQRGGDGCVRQWQFLAPAQVALLAGRRVHGAPGLAGGEDGAPGRDERDVGNGWEPAPPTWEAKAGDRLRISTPGGGGFGAPSPGETPTGAVPSR